MQIQRTLKNRNERTTKKIVFMKLKSIYISVPNRVCRDFQEPFKLRSDASEKELTVLYKTQYNHEKVIT